ARTSPTSPGMISAIRSRRGSRWPASTSGRSQELLGHQSLAMTLRYANLSPAHKRDAVRHLERTRTGTTTGTSVTYRDSAAPQQGEPTSRVIGEKREWRRPGSNRGPRDYETLALAN